MGQVFLADAHAGVPDDEAIAVFAGLLKRRFLGDERYALAFGCVFDGIADDVDQHLLDPQLVAAHLVVAHARMVVADAERLAIRLQGGDVLDAVKHRLQVEGLLVQLQLAAFDLGDVQYVVDQGEQEVAG